MIVRLFNVNNCKVNKRQSDPVNNHNWTY